MARAVTPVDFSDNLIRDFNWRLKELSDLKLVSEDRDPIRQRGRKRALLVMCYAHWEGHAKYCAEQFIEYVTIRRFRFTEVVDHFYQVRFANLIAKGGQIPLVERMSLVKDIVEGRNDRLSHIPDGLVNTKSNLNSEVLKDICLVCGIPSLQFDHDMEFLDKFLLRRRNDVAHGQAVFVDSIDPVELVDRTTGLMRSFRDALDNSVAESSYKNTNNQ